MNLRGPWPVRLRLIFAFLLVGVPPMLGAAYLASALISSSFEKNAGQWLTETARFVIVEITDREDDAAQIAATLTGAVSQTANETVDGFKAALKPYEPVLAADGFDVLMIYDATGAIRYTSLPFSPAKNLPATATRAIFAGTLDGNPVLVAGATVKLSASTGNLYLFLGDALDTASFSSLKAVPSLQLDFFAMRGDQAIKLYETSNLSTVPPKVILQRLATEDDPILLDDPPGDLFLAAVSGLKDQDGALSGFVFCGVGGQEGLDGPDQQLRLLWVVFLFGALIFVLAGAFVSARFVKPLRALSQGVRSVASGDFSQRVPETGDKETVELAARFNAMAGELEEARAREAGLRRKERLSTLGEAAMVIAHEVRNPLGIIKTSSDLVRSRAKLGPKEEELLDYVTEEVHRIDNLLTEVLDFAHPKEPHRSIFVLRDLVDRIQGFVAPEMTRKGLSPDHRGQGGGRDGERRSRPDLRSRSQPRHQCHGRAAARRTRGRKARGDGEHGLDRGRRQRPRREARAALAHLQPVLHHESQGDRAWTCQGGNGRRSSSRACRMPGGARRWRLFPRDASTRDARSGGARRAGPCFAKLEHDLQKWDYFCDKVMRQNKGSRACRSLDLNASGSREGRRGAHDLDRRR